jgi:RNA polymerase sigma factor (sigma-70 family)
MNENIYDNLKETDIALGEQEDDDELFYEQIAPESDVRTLSAMIEDEMELQDDDVDARDEGSWQDTDSLSLYLAECRRTPLLDADMEKELSGKIELSRVLSDLHTDWIERNGREMSYVDQVVYLVERMAGNRSLFEHLCNYLNVPESEKLSEQCANVSLRQAIDGTIEQQTVEKMSELLGTDSKEIEKNMILLSVDSRLIPWAVLDAEHDIRTIADLEIAVYKNGFMQTIVFHMNEIKRHFELIKDAAHEASNTLVQANLRLVVSIAKKRKAPCMTMHDFIQEGNIGLMKAAWRFNHRMGYRFSTYATWWIRQAMGRAIQEQSRIIRLPGHMVESIREVRKSRDRLQSDNGHMPTDIELAAFMEISSNKLDHILQAGSNRMVSLETPIGEDGGQLGDLIEDQSTPEPENQALNRVMWEQIQDILSTLTARERRVIETRFGLIDDIDKTLAEVGKELGLTKERIRQIEKQALAKLRHPYYNRKLENCYK